MLGFLLVAEAGLAQDQDSPFRPGQWGTDFYIGNGFASVGVLRFINSGTAWTLDLGAAYQSVRDTGVAGLRELSFQNLSLSIGQRRHRTVVPRVIRVIDYGLNGFYSRDKDVQAGQETRVSRLGAGVSFGVGGQWMVTRQLSVGGRWGASVSYYRQVNTYQTPAESRFRAFVVSLGDLGLRGVLYY
jgi:hypothetical protein